MEIVLYKPVMVYGDIRNITVFKFDLILETRHWAGLELGSEVETLVFKLMGKLDDKE